MNKNNNFCTKLTPKCLTGDDGATKPGLGGLKTGYLKSCCINAIKETCFYLIDLFAENDVKYWLDFGTLLGAVRNKKIIPWDKDADIGILKTEEEKLLSLKDRINKDGFYFVEKHGLYRIHYSKTNLNFVDIFTWELCTEKNKTLMAQKLNVDNKNLKLGFVYGIDKSVSGMNNKSFPHYFIEDTLMLKFYEKLACVPKDYKKFLELRYGKEWEVPQRGWTRANCCSSTKIEEWCKKERNWMFVS